MVTITVELVSAYMHVWIFLDAGTATIAVNVMPMGASNSFNIKKKRKTACLYFLFQYYSLLRSWFLTKH